MKNLLSSAIVAICFFDFVTYAKFSAYQNVGTFGISILLKYFSKKGRKREGAVLLVRESCNVIANSFKSKRYLYISEFICVSLFTVLILQSCGSCYDWQDQENDRLDRLYDYNKL